MLDFIYGLENHLAETVSLKFERAADLAPYIAGAFAMLVFGWFLAEVAYRSIISLGHKLKLEVISDKVGLKHFLQKIHAHATPSQVIAKSVKGYLIFLFFIEATKIVRMTQVTEFLTRVIGYIPELIIAMLIMLVGIRIGHTMEVIITTSLSFAKSNTAMVLGVAAKYTIAMFAVLAALSQLDIAPILVQTLFVGFVAMLTLAGGLAFGLGGKDVVHELLEHIKKVEFRIKK